MSPTFAEDFEGHTTCTPRAEQAEAVDAMLDDVVAWGDALRVLRRAQEAAQAA